MMQSAILRHGASAAPSGKIFRSAFAAFAGWRARRQVEAELSALTDRELADIGISRYDIGRIGRDTAHDVRVARSL